MDSDEVLMRPLLSQWCSRSMMYTLRDTWKRHHQLDSFKHSLTTDPKNLQREFFKLPSGEHMKDKALQVLRRRLRQWELDDELVIESIATLCTFFSSRLPSCVEFAILRCWMFLQILFEQHIVNKARMALPLILGLGI